MEIYYEGSNITDDVQITKCVARDTCGGRCDSLEIEFENAAGWYNWAPAEDDKITVEHNGYDTGIMYVNTILPEEGRFRILATSLPCRAREKAYRSFTGKTIAEIMQACATATGMDYQIFGIDGGITIPYIQRENEGCAAFLYRLLKLEGAAFKVVNGKYTAIGLNYAQTQEAHQTIEITTQQEGVEYKRNGQKLRALSIETPYARATAEDAAVPEAHNRLTTGKYPARDEAQAGRWARGLLLHENRICESLSIQSEFNIGFTAVTRIDIEGNTDAVGEWLIEEAEHDFILLSSKAKLHRCIDTIS